MNISLEVLAGDDIQVGNTFIKHPTLKDLKPINESEYSDFIRTFCAKPFDIIEALLEAKIDYEEIGEYELFNMLFSEAYFNSFEFRYVFNLFFDVYYLKEEKTDDGKIEKVLKTKIVFPEVVDGDWTYFLLSDEGTKEILIDKDNFDGIRDTIKFITGYSNKIPPKFKDETTKEMYMEDVLEEAQIARQQKKNNSIITMADLIGAIILDTAYTYETVWDMYLYQFHSCTRMILKREEYKNTMTGIYTGNLDPKKVNMEKIYWLNKN